MERTWKVVVFVAAVSLAGCSSTSYTTYLIPRQGYAHPALQRESPEGRCATTCQDRYYEEADDGAYARCLKSCPGVRVYPGKECTAESYGASLVCFTHKKASGPSAAGVTGLVLVLVAVGGLVAFGIGLAMTPNPNM